MITVPLPVCIAMPMHNHHIRHTVVIKMLSRSIMGQCAVIPAGLSSEEASPGVMSASGGTTFARWVLAIIQEFKGIALVETYR